MCGIAGFVNAGLTDERAQALLRRMTDLLIHRGPDDEGHWYGDSTGLGMRRLSIIDVDGGKQPIANEDGSVIVVFNGEIYNYQALRADLERSGHRFATNSDTETIVHAYEEDGLDFVHRLDGMFAIALWDRTRKRLVLARDRFGKKPLYYSFDGQRLTFASELKALLLAPNVRRELDPLAVSQYFAFGYVPAPQSILAGIRKLGAGQTLTFEGGAVEERRYWQLDFTPRCGDDEATAANTVRELVLNAVRKRLISDVPLGAFLSGGLDSSIVVAAMSRVGTERVKTFSIGFEEESHSELEYARLIAQRYETDHHEFIVRPDLLDVLPRLAWTFDEPFADASMVPTYYVSKLARQHVTVALSGDGGDELFGGYRRYTRAMEDQQLAQRLGPLRSLASLAGATMPDGMKGKTRLSSLASDPAEHYIELAAIFPSPLRGRVTMPRFSAPDGIDPRRAQLERFAEVADLDFFTRMQHVDVEVYLPDDILMKVDKASMFASLEARAPLLDYQLAEYVASLPSGVRNPGYQKKHLLKRALHDLLPEETLTRPKMGFALPVDRWLRGPLRDFTWDVLTSEKAKSRHVCDAGQVRRLLEAQRRDVTANNGARIWALLCFELWCRAYLDGEGLSSAPQGEQGAISAKSA